MIVIEVESLVDSEADGRETGSEVAVIDIEELVTLVVGIDESVTLLLALALEDSWLEGLTVVAEAEADFETEAEEEGAAVLAREEEVETEVELDRLADDDDDAAATLDDARETEELELELAAAEVVVVVLVTSLPKTDILYQPPHFWFALPAQFEPHWLSVTKSVEARLPQ